MHDEVADGWKISQVEALVGLPRRDIQRACYEGAGGLGIVKPRNTTWGWRVYEVPDVAKLFLLAQGRRQGKTLDEVRDELVSCEGARDVLRKLVRCEQAAREACDAHAGASMSARALRCAIEQGDVTVFAGLIDASFAEDARALRAADAAELLVRAMNASGMGLTCELWLGPATWTYANAALEASQLDAQCAGATEEECRVEPLGDAKEQSAI